MYPGLSSRIGRTIMQTGEHVAIATFERMVISGNSKYDKFQAGDKTALDPSEQRGMKVFFSNNARCDSCHDGAAFTTNQFANIGIGMDKLNPDLGRFVNALDQAGVVRCEGRYRYTHDDRHALLRSRCAMTYCP